MIVHYDTLFIDTGSMSAIVPSLSGLCESPGV